MAEINKIQFKRGSTLSNAGTPAAGEPIYDTSTGKLYIGDGSTAAGGATPSLVAISDDKLPLTGGTLTGTLNVDEYISFRNQTNTNLRFTNGFIRFYTSGTERLSVNDYNVRMPNHSLAIGTSTTTARLNIQGTGTTGTSSPTIKLANASTNGETYGINSDDNGLFQIYDDSDDSTKFSLTSAGVGTFAGNVITDGIFKVDSAPDNDVIQFDQSGRKSAIKTYFSSSSTGSKLILKVSDGNTNGGMVDALDIRPAQATFAGNVGINVSPNVPLQFSNDADTRKIVLYEGANNDYQFYGFGIESSTLVYSTYTTSDDHVFFAGTGTSSRNELMRIGGDGAIKFNNAFTFPTSIGTAGQVLKVPSSGTVLEWGTGGASSTFTEKVNIETSGGSSLSIKDTDSSGASSTGYIDFNDSSNARQGYVGNGSGGNGHIFLYADAGSPVIGSGNSSAPQYYDGSYHTIWHAGNDGSSSGLDADLLDGQHGSYYQPASSAITTSNIGSQSVTAAVRLNAFDNRTISPSEFGNTRVRFGFTSWGNNNSSPYADAFHMSSYGDSSGGSANLVMFKKSGIGMRIWQNSFNNSSAYGSYADVVMTTGDYAMSGKLRIAGAGIPNSWHNINVDTGGMLGQYNNSTGIGVYCVSNHNELFYYNYGLGVYADGIVSFASLDFKHNNSTSLLQLMQSGVKFGTAVMPNTDVSYNLGSSSLRWQYVYGNQFYAWDWFRAKGNSGLYWQDHGGGWNMQDSTYIRVYGSKMVYLTNGTLISGAIRRADHVGGWLEGSYNNVASNDTKSNPIYTIGSSYNPTNTALSNMYGIGYSHGNFWGTGSGKPGGWGMYAASDGDIRCILDAQQGIIWASSSMKVGSNTVWHSGNDGSGSGLDADVLDGVEASQFIRSDVTDIKTGGSALQFQPSSGSAKVNMDARVSGSGARLHKWNNSGGGYLPYYENWWDGDSYQSFGTENNRWVFNQQIHVSDAYGNAYFGGNQSDEWGRIEFEGFSNGTYIYANTGSFKVDNAHWTTYDDGELDLGGGQTSNRWRNLYLQSQIIGGFGAMTTGGTANWNSSTNARSGAGYTLLLGSHSNGPSGTGDYFHSHSYEYGSSGGSNNITQFAIPYIVTAGGGMYMRSRYQGSWSGWVQFHDTLNMQGIAKTGNTYGSFNVTNGSNNWAGITYSTHSSKPTIMFKDNHGDGGLYHQGSSSWRWYYAQAHTCMGINGSTTSSSYGCYITGSVYTTGSYSSSDARFKTNIKTIDNSIDKVMNMRGVYYDWNDDHKEEKGEGRQVGVIAQELNEVLPEAVIHTEEDEYSVDYGKITGVLIEAIKDLKNEINELKKGCCNGS